MNTVLLVAVLSILGSLLLFGVWILILYSGVRYIEHTSPMRRLRQAQDDARAVLDYAGKGMDDLINQRSHQRTTSRRSDFNIADRWSEWN